MTVLVRYTSAATLARIADGATSTALILLALDRTKSAAVGGVLTAATMLPHIVAAPAAGLLSDRVRSVRLLYVVALLTFGAGLAGTAFTLGSTHLAVPLACALISGIVGPLLTGGMTSLLGELLPAPALPCAFAVDSATYNVSGIVAPAMVALVAGVASPFLALLALVASSVIAALTTLAVPLRRREAAQRANVRRGALIGGALALWRVVPLRGTAIATTVSIAGTGGALPIAVVLFAERLGQPASAGGGLLSAFAVGALTGSLALSAKPLREAHAGRAVYLSVLATGLVLAAAAASPSYVVALVVFVLAGLVEAPMLTATFLIRNTYAPPEVRSQVFTTAAGLKIGSAALGAALAGVAAAPLGGTGLLLVAGGVQVLALAVGLLSERIATGRGPGNAVVDPSGTRAKASKGVS